jgi:hypothetical protein
MAIFNSYVKLPEGNLSELIPTDEWSPSLGLPEKLEPSRAANILR